MNHVRIPAPLRSLTGGKAEAMVEGNSIEELLQHLEDRYRGMRERLVDEEGRIRPFVNLYINQEDIRFRGGLKAVLRDGDQVSIVPAVAGGCNGRAEDRGPASSLGYPYGLGSYG